MKTSSQSALENFLNLEKDIWTTGQAARTAWKNYFGYFIFNIIDSFRLKFNGFCGAFVCVDYICFDYICTDSTAP
jgi:hypothetical protein